MNTSGTKLLILILAIVSFSITGCSKERIVGNGNVEKEIRNTQEFSRVIVRGDMRVELEYDSINRAEVEAESNIIPYVRTVVNNNTITIDFSNDVNIREHSEVKVTLHTPHVVYTELQGSGSIFCNGFDESDAEFYLSGSGNIEASYIAGNIKASISGSGSIMLSGSANQTEMRISGSGNIKALNLIQNTCNASISGSGDIYVNASQKIKAAISGSGCIYYTGNPLIERNISGSGNVYRY